MRISISVVAADVPVSNDFISFDVSPDMSLDDIKGFVEAEINVPPSAQKFIINGQIATQTSRSLTDLGMQDGDLLSLAIQTKQSSTARRREGESSQQPPAQRQRNGPDPEKLRLLLLGDENERNKALAYAPELVQAINDPQRFAQMYDERSRRVELAQRERAAKMASLEADPFNPEKQLEIEEMIRQERVMENLQKAHEENPESLAQVTMLYIGVLVNNVPVKAFVDSGAQTTIMSPDAAERCGIMRLIDKRFAGIARGVGTAQILGRVHSADIQIGPYSLASSFTVMEGKDVDLLLGLDMLKRHQMCIDLKENCLRFADDCRVPFLPENEIPRMMEHINENEPKIPGPDGMEIGAETGTVQPATSKSVAAGSSSQPSTSSGSRITIHPPGSAGNINRGRASGTTAGAGPSSAAAPTPSEQPLTDSPFGTRVPVTEHSIAQIMELGFSREDALMALQQAGGNVDGAISLLL